MDVEFSCALKLVSLKCLGHLAQYQLVDKYCEENNHLSACTTDSIYLPIYLYFQQID